MHDIDMRYAMPARPPAAAPRNRMEKKSLGFFFKAFFALSYLLLILASVAFVRADKSLVDNINILRILLIGAAGALWIAKGTADRSLSVAAIVVGILLFPYLLTESFISYVDVLSLMIFSAALARVRETEKYLVYLAYGSLAVVCVICVLAAIGILPSIVFEWEGRSKNAYGFTNPNTLFFYIFSSAFTFFIYREWRGIAISGLVMALMYASVGSRTFAIAYVFILAGFLFFKYINGRLARVGLWATILAVTMSGVLTVYFPFEFSHFTSIVLGVDSDELFSSRFTIMEQAYSDADDVGFWLGGIENVSDSLYAYFANSFGLLVSTAFLVILFARIARLSKRYGSIVLIYSLVFLMIGIVEVPFDGSALMSLVFVYVLFYDESVFQRWGGARALPRPRRRPLLRARY